MGTELIPVSWQSAAGGISLKPGGRLPLLSTRPDIKSIQHKKAVNTASIIMPKTDPKVTRVVIIQFTGKVVGGS